VTPRFQLQLLQKYDADIDKSVKTLAADATSKASQSTHFERAPHNTFSTACDAQPSVLLAVEAAAAAHRAETLKLLVRPHTSTSSQSPQPTTRALLQQSSLFASG
jgi:hypothetical protein